MTSLDKLTDIRFKKKTAKLKNPQFFKKHSKRHKNEKQSNQKQLIEKKNSIGNQLDPQLAELSLWTAEKQRIQAIQITKFH